jgi:thiamine biosynthesis lipoprotein
MIHRLRRAAYPLAFLTALLALYFFGGASPPPNPIRQLSGLTMGTSYRIQLVDVPRGKSEQQISLDVSALLTEMDKGIFSTYADASELSRLNRHPVNIPFEASTHLLEVLSLAKDISELTGGAFDVTIGPLVNLWGFGPKINPADAVPPDAEIQARINQMGYENVVIDKDGSKITKRRSLFIDLSAIAKGYVVDQLARYFDDLGVESYFLEIGGELKIKGLKPGGLSWVPAIEAPMDSASQVYQVFFSRGETIAVAGSGDYRNYFESDGVRYSHEIDPRTGYPIDHSLAAAYVIDESAARADALATAFMVMGLEDARALAGSLGQAVYFIYKNPGDGFLDYASDEFATYMED